MEQLLNDLLSSAVAAAPQPEPSHLDEQLSRLKAAVHGLANFNDPDHIYAWSTIDTD